MAAAAPTRRTAPPRHVGQFRRRLAEFGAFIMAAGAVGCLAALGGYHGADPSWNTATALPPANPTGPFGAGVADALLQSFGLAGAFPAVVLLAWAWRIGSHRGLTSFPIRLVALLSGLPIIAAVLAAIPGWSGVHPSWPVASGMGGAAGRLLAEGGIAAGRAVLGPFGGLMVWGLGAALALSLAVLALGLSRSEWRAAGQGLRRIAAALRGLAAVLGRAMARLGSLGLSVLERINGTRSEPAVTIGPAARTMRADADPVPVIPAPSGLSVPVPPLAKADAPASSQPGAAAAGPRVAAPARKAAPGAAARQESLKLDGQWRLPPLSLLTQPTPAARAARPTNESLQANARLLETVLSDYGVQGQIVEIRPGPVVTLYELEPAPGIRSARVIGLADDVARSLSVTAVRIATVPGRNVIGIEVPNAKRETVMLAELLGEEEWRRQQGRLALALGKDISGAAVIADLSRMPHLLVAGTTGSGKSVGINAMILSLLYRLTPEQCRLILIDPKMLELSVYNDIPHLLSPVVTEPPKAVMALKWTVREMERRYRAMSQLGVRNIAGYNERVDEARARGEVVTRRVQTGFDSETGKPVFEDQPLALDRMPFIVVVIDEMADLMMVAGKDIETAVQRLAQMARAAGIHVVMATQRPSVDVITGTIKANFPTRISFQVISKFDSRTILGEQGAEQLLGMGDMLYMMGGGRITRVHGPFVADAEVEAVVAFLREQGEPNYDDEVTEQRDEPDANGGLPGIAGASDGEKGLFDQAVDLVAREGKASTSFIQRHLQIGYNRAARLIEQMEKEGIVGAANHVGKREVLVRRIPVDQD